MNVKPPPSYSSAYLLSTFIPPTPLPARTLSKEGKKNCNSLLVYVRAPDRGVAKYRTKWLLSISFRSVILCKIPHG